MYCDSKNCRAGLVEMDFGCLLEHQSLGLLANWEGFLPMFRHPELTQRCVERLVNRQDSATAMHLH